MKTPRLETERLILKRGTYQDYVKVYEYDFTRLRNIDGEFEFVKLDPEKIKGFEKYADEEDNVLDFILYLKDNTPIGNIVMDRYDKKLNSLEISCNLHPNYWRKGYMTEAILKVMDYIFTNLDIDNVIYGYGEGNYKSKGVNDKIGFKYLNSYIEHYIRINKNIKEYKFIMSKEDFMNKYNGKRTI